MLRIQEDETQAVTPSQDSDYVEKVRERTDILDVVSRVVQLKPSGRNFKGLCPFHQEKTPSFSVAPSKQMFYCFGCGTGGDVFAFLMKHQRMEFREAVEHLGHEAGLPPPRWSGRKDNGTQSRVLSALSGAEEFYTRALAAGSAETVRQCLSRRRISAETIREFGIGYAPDAWDALTKALSSSGMTPGELASAGLVIQRPSGGYYDRFRNRIMVPIRDARGRTVGFGARSVDDSLPKYMNSPQTAVFDKGRLLFGLSAAAQHIPKDKTVILVEGYFDMILPFQEGVKNIVATMGTALTPAHVMLLKRYATSAVIVYDADAAGKSAGLRGLEVALESELDIAIAVLPEGFDPDSFIRARGPEPFLDIVSRAKGIFDHKMDLLLQENDAATPEGKARIVSGMLDIINKVKNAVLKREYLKKLAARLGVDESAVSHESERAAHSRGHAPPAPAVQKAHGAEELLLSLVMDDPRAAGQLKGDISPDDFSSPSNRAIAAAVFSSLDAGEPLSPAAISARFRGKDEEKLISLLAVRASAVRDKQKALADCIARLKDARLRADQERNFGRIAGEKDWEEQKKLLELQYSIALKRRNVQKGVMKN